MTDVPVVSAVPDAPDPALRAAGLGKRYGRRWALADCTVEIPAGRVTGLVGPNGAGKSTLLGLAAGMITPTAGTIEVCGGRPAAGAAQLAKVGFVAQDTPTYAGLSVADHLALGARLNPGWDSALAEDRIQRLGLDPAQRAGRLSGGQRAQLALTLGIAKRPRLLILDEPVAALDPLARREFMTELIEAVAEHRLSVVLSSHLVSDLERTCDHLVVLVGSRVGLAGDVDELLAAHRWLTGPRRGPAELPPPGLEVVSTDHGEHGTRLLVRTGDGDGTGDGAAAAADSGWTAGPVDLEDLVLAYIRRPTAPASAPAPGRDGRRPALEMPR